ncbi:hypothetical protein K490DRAFT_69420 [Saccharata proteae CBS 121410]|uniref:Uncharacterized protein n=1 Tax=Saccharata proteae CBS 121410 TaxID=1314787 RepID=A0A9P4LU71_9PEZI|nr:hypothetical protein K490DRAFT_69420 [Saccharata proteae CBS 121410]
MTSPPPQEPTPMHEAAAPMGLLKKMKTDLSMSFIKVVRRVAKISRQMALPRSPKNKASAGNTPPQERPNMTSNNDHSDAREAAVEREQLSDLDHWKYLAWSVSPSRPAWLRCMLLQMLSSTVEAGKAEIYLYQALDTCEQIPDSMSLIKDDLQSMTRALLQQLKGDEETQVKPERTKYSLKEPLLVIPTDWRESLLRLIANPRSLPEIRCLLLRILAILCVEPSDGSDYLSQELALRKKLIPGDTTDAIRFEIDYWLEDSKCTALVRSILTLLKDQLHRDLSTGR